MPVRFHLRFRTCAAAAAVVLFTSLFATAQTAAAPAKSAPAPQPTTAREASSGMATGRRQQQTARPNAATPADPATEASKHISNVKWEDRQAATPTTLDAGSKDAAKALTTLDGASKDAAKSKTVQPTNPTQKKRENSVDSISVQH